MASITRDRFDAVLFDLDGVLTDTSSVHAATWQKVFDEFLGSRSSQSGEAFRPFDISSDYHRYLDGKLRYEGARSFLESRGIQLPFGGPQSSSEDETVCGLANRKNDLIAEEIASNGVGAYEESARVLEQFRSGGFKTAVVTASHNCEVVLQAAGIANRFDARVDGNVADRLGLPGKPAPDTYLEAARRLGATPRRAVIIEDAISGVQAGRAGGFGLIIGVDRTGRAEALRASGADRIVSDLSELL